ncbi:helix-turn-helix transcriptional regulator [Solwaraspora sp. WMMA2080]|uniref:helix-turn-helix domain-containing protein n=1 Tax=unclassified Solwaraspora TaxID=2627926 RepID=UPI00248CFFD8|nr:MULTISPECIES: helix-turn-helix transcriptional regulator [unclassified Solwaraspora]WBB97108.1 helix-turn-helix transcriptional regulator [Solwaraspora sp. WMMA2059]WBC18990.1 helix-turn-helix transcriptional regulator [Solwaraspora sp. WMMA2080]
MSSTVGDNVGRLRRLRGLTQEQLAEAAGLAVETIQKLEQNKPGSPRMSTLRAIAAALAVPTSVLVGPAVADPTAGAGTDGDEIAVDLLRRALTPARGLSGTTVGDVSTDPPTVRELQTSIAEIDRIYHGDDYATALARLPVLIGAARSLVDASGGDQRTAGAGQLAQAYQIAGTTLIQLRRFDLAYHALSLALDVADESGNELVAASVVTTMCWLLLRQGRFDEAGRLAVATADAVEPRFSRTNPTRLAVWGWLMLRGSAAAIRDGRADDAGEMLDAAGAAAVRIGEHLPADVALRMPVTMGAFCPVTVEMKRVEMSVVAGDPVTALALAERVPPGNGRATSDNRNRHQLDRAWANAERGDLAEAARILSGLRAESPTWLRHQRYARDIVTTILTRRRRPVSQELAALADLLGAGS